MIRKSILTALVLCFGLTAPAFATQQTELNKDINVVGVNGNIVFVAVVSPGPSAACFLSLMTAPITEVSKLQYETLRDAKIAGQTVTIFFEDTTCEINQVQIQ